MKFSNYLTSIENVSIYPVITLILFVVVFVGAIFWIFTRDKEYISKLENIPLDNDNFINLSKTKNRDIISVYKSSNKSFIWSYVIAPTNFVLITPSSSRK